MVNNLRSGRVLPQPDASCEGGSTRRQMTADVRQSQLEIWSHDFDRLGFDFDQLTKSELEDLAAHQGIAISNWQGGKHYKADVLFFVELHYAQRRRAAGCTPDHYLYPSFDAAKANTATLRQILTQHGIRYVHCAQGSKVSIGDTRKVRKTDLINLLADRIDEMRDEAGFVAPAEDTAELDKVHSIFQTLSTGMPNPSGNGAAPRKSPFDLPAAAFLNGKGPVKDDFRAQELRQDQVQQQRQRQRQQQVPQTQRNYFAAANPRSAFEMDGGFGSVDRLFPADDQASGVAASSASTPVVLIEDGGTQSQAAPAAYGRWREKQAVTGGDQTMTGEHQTAGENRTMTGEKIEEIVTDTITSFTEVVQAVEAGNVPAAMAALWNLREDLVDDLRNPPAQPSQPYPASTRTLRDRKILRLAAKVKDAGEAIVGRVRQGDLSGAVGVVDDLSRYLGAEL